MSMSRYSAKHSFVSSSSTTYSSSTGWSTEQISASNNNLHSDGDELPLINDSSSWADYTLDFGFEWARLIAWDNAAFDSTDDSQDGIHIEKYLTSSRLMSAAIKTKRPSLAKLLAMRIRHLFNLLSSKSVNLSPATCNNNKEHPNNVVLLYASPKRVE